MRASGLAATVRARSIVPTTRAAAPSLIPEELPAVTEPSLLKAGFNAPTFSAVVPARGYSSRSMRTGPGAFCHTGSGPTIDRHARLARCLARNVHARAGRHPAAEHHVADVRSFNGRPGNRFTDDNGPEIGRGQILEHAAERSNRRSARTENDRIGIFGHF